MKIGFVGIGRMGKNMVLNLLEHKHAVIAYNNSPAATKDVARKGATASFSLEEMVALLPKQKIIWLMIPAGKPVDTTLRKLTPLLRKGDIIIDGGNSFYKDSQRRYRQLRKKGISYIDCGTSGGMEGARHGACMMIGGDKISFKKTEKLFHDMTIKNGYGYMGKTGAGHFVKMVHNGIEYGMMGAINEGIETIKKHSKTFGTDVQSTVKVYAHGSIIESHLMTWLLDAFTRRNYLEKISCTVPKGETEEEMKKLEKLGEMPVLKTARQQRVKSRTGKSCQRYVAAMRNEFGGHKVNKK